MNTTIEPDVLVLPNENTKELNSVMDLVNSIDLSMVKLKIMDEEEGQGWDEDYANHVEKLYRRYLCMVKLNFEGSANVPTREIDLFWHQHILDTRAYARDCHKLFGEFLHHFPYFGMRGEQDAQDLLDSFEETKNLYFQLFGEEYCKAYEGNDSGSSTCHKCGSTCHKCASGCSGVKCSTCS